MSIQNIHPYKQAYNKVFSKNVKSKYLNFLLNSSKSGGGLRINDFDFDTTKEDGDIHIFIGNKHQCLLGIIYYDNPHKLLLDNFSYYKKCNITETLERKSGTKRMMLSFIKYVAETEPSVDAIELSDTSSFQCGDNKISNYKTYLFKYGKGYYEYNYGFTLLNKLEHNIHIQNIEISSNIKINKEKFKTYIQNLNLGENIINQDYINEFISHLTDNILVSEFLHKYRIKSNLCDVFKLWIEFLFTEYKLNPLFGSIYYNTMSNLLNNNSIIINKDKKTKSITKSITKKVIHSNIFNISKTKTKKIKNHILFYKIFQLKNTTSTTSKSP